MATPFLYNGQAGVQTDPNGLLNMRARYYSPYLCRFLNADPSGFSGGPNWFAYADGNQISKSDPFGLCATEPVFYRLRRESQPGDHFYPGVNPSESFWGFAIRSAGNTLANPGFMNSMSFGGPGSNFMGTTGLPIKSLDRPVEVTTPAAIGGARVASEVGLSAGEITRIQNAANAIGKPINLVGSRAGGTANAASDWDYVIDGLTNSNRNTIKNSLPGAPVRADQVPRTIDFLKPPLDTTLPYFPFTPKR
jgi:RHS repeat-associated protein